jgi:DnaJ-class molecular chaperone
MRLLLGRSTMRLLACCLVLLAAATTDLYEVLGVPRDATTAEIKKAYRSMAAEIHPDKLPPDTSDAARERATAAFVELALAHEVLTDPVRRQTYDDTGMSEEGDEAREARERREAERGPPKVTETPLGVDARFRRGAFRFRYSGSGVRPVEATRVPVVVTLAELLTGVNRTLTLARRQKCETCAGTGTAEPESRETCGLCEGTGAAAHVSAGLNWRNSRRFFRQAVTTRCGACGGTGFSRGAACSTCDGAGYVDVRREINVEIPPGAPDGHEITFKGLGDEHPQRATGDLVLVVTVAQHPVFSRSEAAPENLYCNASVGLLDALLGFDRKLTGLSGERLLVEHRRVAFSSFTLSIRDEGLPVFGNATQRGQVTVFIRVDFPKTLTALQADVLRRVGLRDEELRFIFLLQALYAYQYAQTVAPDSDEVVFAKRCVVGAEAACVPDPLYATWWRSTVGVS